MPVPYAVYYYDSERRIDPQQYEKVKAVKELPMFGWSWEAILLAFLGRVTYGLYAEPPSGGRTELVTALKEPQARYLERQLQGLLDTGAWPVEEGDVAAQGTAVQPTSAEPALEWLAEAAEDEVAVDQDGTETVRQLVSCPSCEAANPTGSA